MPSDYAYIHNEHRLDYGRKLAVWAQDHLANRYSDRTHFIFELLQNAEDALRERGESSKPTSVHFELKADGLEVRHFGKPFSPNNVKSICAINESTKRNDLTEIGRFGIGFKSVYAFTKRPEIHSDDEHFAIDEFVLPIAVPPRKLACQETLFWIPFDPDDALAGDEVAAALRNLGCERLLFLKSVTEISWKLLDGTSGEFLRNSPTPEKDGQIITLIGEVKGDGVIIEQSWLLFSKVVNGHRGEPAGSVEIAFRVDYGEDGKLRVVEVNESKLVVFFPTEVSTGLGFIIQGPYRTTPSRDNVPQNDEWNRMLIRETASLLVESLACLKQKSLLVADTLGVFPIDARRYGVESMFRPLFDDTLKAFSELAVLPAAGGGHVSGSVAKLARGEGLRELFSPSQLGKLVGEDGERYWLSEDITRDRAAMLRDFLIKHVDVKELTPDSLSSRLTSEFLEAQNDGWIERLYAFLSGQKSLRQELLKKQIPIIRCEDGSHVSPFKGGIPQVFLPSGGKTGFRTVREAVCASEAALEFLKLVGLDVPDPVDDVILNILTAYDGETIMRGNSDYEADLQRIKVAFQTDSEHSRKKLVEALRGSRFVKATNARTGEAAFRRPGEVYRRTARLAIVFDGVEEAWLVDDSVLALKGVLSRDLLQACGALDVLRTRECASDLTYNDKAALRMAKAAMTYSSERITREADCPELGGVLSAIESDSTEKGQARAVELWALLRDTLHDRREGYFQATYSWSYSHRSWSSEFPTAWVRRLRNASWIPSINGGLKKPTELCASEICPMITEIPSPFLIEILGFRSEAIKELAEKEGIDLEILTLLKRHNVSAEVLRTLLGDTDESDDGGGEGKDADRGYEDGENEDDRIGDEGGDWSNQAGGGNHGGGGHGGGKGGSSRSQGKGGQRTSFQTYISVVDGEPDHGEGFFQEERLALEAAAINHILDIEHTLQRTPTNNQGFDLYEGESLEFPVRFVEVKALKGEWSRPVAMSEAQFQLAEAEQERYSLYVVEHACDAAKRKLHRVTNPAGTAKYFCFDSGWSEVAKHQNL